MHNPDSPEAGEIRGEDHDLYVDTDVRVAGNTNGQSRGHVSSINAELLQRACEWVESNHVDIPGVALNEDGFISNEAAFRGFYRVAQTGPPSGLMMATDSFSGALGAPT